MNSILHPFSGYSPSSKHQQNYLNFQSQALQPQATWREDNNSWHLNLKVPGLTSRDVKIELKGNDLRIFSERESSQSSILPGFLGGSQTDKQQENQPRQLAQNEGEKSKILFDLLYYVPDNIIKHDEINAAISNGGLEVTFPKLVQSKTQNSARSIHISSKI